MATAEPRDPREEEDLDESEEEPSDPELEDEDEEEETEQTAPAHPPPEPPKPDRKRKKRHNPHRGETVGLWADGTDTSTGLEAEFAWPELLAELKKKYQLTPYDVQGRIVRIDPPPTAPVGNFDGSAVLGTTTMSPGDHLIRWIEDNVHLPIARGPQVYAVQFINKRRGNLLKRGRLSLPHPDEIAAVRRAKDQQPMVPNGPPQMYGGAPQQPGYGAPPSQYGAPPQYGWAPSAPHGQESSELAQLRADLARSREHSARVEGQMAEIVRALREGRQPNVVAVPAGPETEDERTARIVAVALRAAGLGVPPPVTPAGPPPAPPPPPRQAAEQANDLMAGLDSMLSAVQKLRKFGKSVDTVFSSTPVSVEEVEVLEKEDEKKETLPWVGIDVAEAKLFGHPVKYPKNRESGKFDWEGFAMENPGLMEEGVKLISKLIDPIADLAKRAAEAKGPVAGGTAEVVDNIPAGAKDAGGGGENGGWPSSV